MQREDRPVLFEAQKQAVIDQNAMRFSEMFEQADPGVLALFACSIEEAIALGEMEQ